MTTITNTKLAADLSAVVNRWNTRENQMIDFISQPTGTVTVTDGAGETHVLPSFPQLQIDMMTQTNALSGQLANKVDLIKNAEEDISEKLPSGFYRQNIKTNGWPVPGTSWWHLLSLSNPNPDTYYSLQFACAFSGETLYFRSTQGDGNAPWRTMWHSGNFDPDSRLKLTGGTLSGLIKIERPSARVILKSTEELGREIAIVSNGTPNVGFRDETNGGQWLFRIDGNNNIALAGNIISTVGVQALSTGNAVYFLRDDAGVSRGTVSWVRSNDSIMLHRYNVETGSSQGWLRINADGTITSSGGITAPEFNGRASSADRLNSSTKINGTSFNGTADIITARWGAERTLTIGGKSRAVNGTANVTWTLAEMGAVSNEGGVANIRKMTQAAYNALATKDPNTLYIIT